MTAIKSLAEEESRRQEIERSKGRSGSENPHETHLNACYELMQQFERFMAEKKRNPQNRYTAKPKGLEHLEFQKTEDPSLENIEYSGKILQNGPIVVVREEKKCGKRQLSTQRPPAPGKPRSALCVRHTLGSRTAPVGTRLSALSAARAAHARCPHSARRNPAAALSALRAAQARCPHTVRQHPAGRALCWPRSAHCVR